MRVEDLGQDSRLIGVPDGELGIKMGPLEGELPLGDLEALADPAVTENLRCIEAVPPGRGLSYEGTQIVADSGQAMGCEALQLRVLAISGGLPGQHLLGEQGLPPAGQQALAVKEGRMN